MTNSAVRILKDVDVILFVLDGSQEISTGDQFVMEKVMEARRTPRVLVINKIDKLTDEELKKKREEVEEKLGNFDAIVEISGQYAINLPKLLEALDPYLEEGIQFYPEDMYTDMPIYRIITEVVREKILNKTREEIPHSVAIEIINVEKRDNGKDKFDINIYVERDSQKGIIIGKNGKLLKEIGMEARKEIEELLGREIYLNLWVKVKEDWRKKKPFLKELGYFSEE
jgi:GTP-binding protein Era